MRNEKNNHAETRKKKNNLNKRTRRRVIPKVEITQSIPEEGRFFSPKKGEKTRMETRTHAYTDSLISRHFCAD